MEHHIYDVLVIGAGPCGLAVAARLCERTPSALFTDDEHRRYHWIQRHSGRMSIMNRKNGMVAKARRPFKQPYSVLVLDAEGDEWLSRWNRLFKLFEIKTLRSPMFFHVDPKDRDALLEFAHQEGRQAECDEITGCVGKERSGHQKKKERKRTGPREPTVEERDRKDYFTPSRKLFADQCKRIVHNYCLDDGLVKQEIVEDLDYTDCEDEHGERLFIVRTNKQIHRARIVVLAIGPGNPPRIPGLLPTERIQGACHAMQAREFPDPVLKAKIEQRHTTNVLVVGGGLTSAQITDLALRCGVTKVWHVLRSQLKVKPFDLNLEWLGKFRNFEQASFWSANSDEERLQHIQAARNGGSITPKYHKILKSHMARGKLSLVTNTTVKSRTWDPETKTWQVQTKPHIDLPPLDYIYYATGIQTDIDALPWLQTMQSKYPIQCRGGLPCINDDLMWNSHVPLFVSGRLGALKIGPGAANLAGARSGAERIAWSIADILGEDEKDPSPEAESESEFDG
ncbi:FAD binding domain protein [Rhizodiscina lignyota]|uniref:L-ornithine N(5)-monooxygenase [NAD(P)H] n=1 Tax=Rhizodiscina lignyota TaxID=1504668 RepID=A0A9P4IH43_9PEZI|nr:FAD binding domain protein [Rhizodiscina lignyota]